MTRFATPWWVAVVTAIFALVCADNALQYWHPHPNRLPEQYSAAYLDVLTTKRQAQAPATVILGDSVLWGYKIPEAITMAALLRKHMPQLNVKNFAYEGGSLPNSAIMYRYLQKQHYPIKAIIFNINQKQFNSADSAYNTLHPALGLASQSFLTTADRARLSAKTLQDKRTLIERQIEDNWRLYRLRTDLREAIFKTDDAATLLTKTIHDVTGETRRAAVADKPDPDRYIGSYDLSPLTNTNIGIIYLREMLNAFCAQRIPVLGFLTPTNHQLLHDSIDTPEYEANLQYVIALPHCSTVTLVNLDHAIPGDEFIDNDHLTPQGQQHLATLLMPQIRKLAQ